MKLPNLGWMTLRWMPICPRPAATATGLCDTTQLLPVLKRSISIGKPIAGFSARTPCLSRADTTLRDLVDVITGVVELQVGDGAGGTADRLPVHPADEAEKCPGRWKNTENIVPLVVQGRAADLDQAGVVGAAVEAQLTQPGAIERTGR